MPTFLGHKYVTPLAVKNNEPRFISDSKSLRRQSVRTGAQRWELEITFTEGRNSDLYGEMLSHYMANGSETAFEIPMPQNHKALSLFEDTLGANSAPALDVSTSASTGDNSISINNGSGHTVLIPAGWFIKFNNHDKVYMVTNSLELANGETDSLSIAPPLVEDVSTSYDLIIKPAETENDNDAVLLTVKHEVDNTTVSYTNGLMQSLKWSFIEDLA